MIVVDEEEQNNQTGSNGKSTEYNEFNNPIILLTFLTPHFVIISPSFT